jgi:hypothetical protein
VLVLAAEWASVDATIAQAHGIEITSEVICDEQHVIV